MTNDQGRLLSQIRMREERANELRQLLQTRAGRIQLWALFTTYRSGMHRCLPPGGSVLIQAILAHEFPAAEVVGAT